MNEKRKFARLEIKIPIKWKLITKPVDMTDHILDVTKDISRGGICFRVGKQLSAGSILELEIKLPNKRVITAQGRVIWCRKIEENTSGVVSDHYAGIEFLSILATEQEEINKFVFEYMVQP